MKNISLLFLCLIPFLVPHAEELELQSIVRFDGTSTLHDFTGFATSKVQRVEWTPIEKAGALTAELIEFDVESLTTDHKKRDKNMMKMFQPEDYPRITGQLKNWKLDVASEEAPILLLKIQDAELEVPVEITDYKQEEDGIHFTSTFSISLKAFGLKRPSALGFIRVGDTIDVAVETILRKPDPRP